MKNPSFCLEADGSLKQNHEYYYQVQFKLLCCDVQGMKCDSMVWTPQEHIVTNIEQDEEFCNDLEETLSKKHLKHVFPELLTRKNIPVSIEDSGRSSCVCKKPRYRKMVKCGKPNCKVGEFHLPCVNLH